MPESLLKWIRPEVRELTAYHVPDSAGLIKLDAMENPYRIEGEARQAWLDAVAATDINRYPDPSAKELRSAIKRHMQPPVGTAMVLGNGSDELIQMLALAVAGDDRCILSLEPGFVMYRLIAEAAGMRYVGIPLNASFEIDLMKTLNALGQHEPAITFIAYPNNPTANCFYDGSIEEIIKAAPGLVVIDEAYHTFAGKSFIDRLSDYEHLLVMRTISKMGLAGLRLGVLFGHPMLISEIDKLRLPYNINSLTQAVATTLLRHPEALEQQAASIRRERDELARGLAALGGVTPFHSDANFILFRLEQGDAGSVFEALRAQGVLIKNMGAAEGLLQNCLRVTVGKPEENRALLAALRTALAG